MANTTKKDVMSFIGVHHELLNRLGLRKEKKSDYIPEPANTTQPDQSFTISELMEGFVVGRIPNVARHVDYDLDPDLVDGRQIAMLSLTETEQYAAMVKEKLTSAQQRYDNLIQQQKNAKLLEKKKQEEIEAKLAQLTAE